VYNKENKRHFISTALDFRIDPFESSEASPACPSDKKRMKIKINMGH
jgi:hypothetical protein